MANLILNFIDDYWTMEEAKEYKEAIDFIDGIHEDWTDNIEMIIRCSNDDVTVNEITLRIRDFIRDQFIELLGEIGFICSEDFVHDPITLYRIYSEAISIENNEQIEFSLSILEADKDNVITFYELLSTVGGLLIDESEVLEAQAAEAIWEDLTKALPMLKIGLVHGRMKPQEKQDIMAAFKNAELDLLVATTVIEVGVDVPNASLMIIENAERLGLSQLHQLRGRVGRGSTASFCVLMYKPPLGKVSQKRLQVLRDSQDGFVISEKDLEIRGPGEVLGTKQTGIVEFKVANLMRDRKMLPTVQHYAKALIVKYPDVAESLIRRWLNNREIYSNA